MLTPHLLEDTRLEKARFTFLFVPQPKAPHGRHLESTERARVASTSTTSCYRYANVLQ